MAGSQASDAKGPLRLVCFELRDQELAFPIDEVRETLPIQPITRVVLTPPALAGVFSLRGDIVPAIDLGVLLGIGRTEIGDTSRIVVIDHEGTAVGIVVDRLRDLRTIERHAGEEDGRPALEPPPPNLEAEVAQLLLGIAATPTGTVRVLDADAIATAPPLRGLAAGDEPK
jgi:purine-binding chemotaxis protein CheW